MGWMMHANALWMNVLMALSLLLGSLGSAQAMRRASDRMAEPLPAEANGAAASESPSEPIQPDRPEAPDVVTGLGTSLFVSGTAPAYVQVPHNAALDPSAEMTLEAWIRRGVTGCQTILGKNYGASYWFGMCNGVLRFYSGGNATSQDGLTSIPANVWTHVAVTWKSGGQRVYYINGQEDYRGAADINGTSTSPLGIGYDIGSGCCEFKGNLAEVRVWNIARTAEDIRRTMHIRLDEPRPGLVANWHLNDSFADSVGGFIGAAAGTGTINFSGPQPPPRPPLVPIDKDFARLADARDGFGFAVLSTTNRAMMVAGYSGISGVTGQVLRLDVGSGSVTVFGAGLPSARYGGTAAYSPANDTVFFFGGDNTGSVAQRSIYAINAATGAVTSQAASLPAGLTWANSAYDLGSGRIAVIGGESSFGPVSAILSFDPIGGDLLTHTLSLPDPRSHAAIIASSATGRLYLIGGRRTGGTAVSTIYEIDLGDGLTGGSVSTSTATLPYSNYGASAVEDPRTKLIYIVGGTGTEASSVKVFDPMTGQLWVSRLELPGPLRDGGGAYDPLNRNIVFAGGYNASSIWRIPVGDGPQIKMARWDWPSAQPAAQVNAIHGEGPKVAVGTNVGGAANGLYLYDEGGRSNPALGLTSGQNVNAVRYSAANDQAWVASNTGLKIYGPGNSIFNYPGLPAGAIKAVDLFPGYAVTDVAPFVAPNLNGMWWRAYSLFSGSTWEERFSNEDILHIEHRAPGDVWAWRSNGNVRRMEYRYDPFSFSYVVTETNRGTLCVVGVPTGMAFDKNGDLWLVGTNDAPILSGPQQPVAFSGICRVGDPAGAVSVNEFISSLGDDATGVAVDRDGRTYVGWASRDDGSAQGTGGLQVLQNLSGTVSTDAMNWMTAPVGSKVSYHSAGMTNWASPVFEVGAVDEKLWYSSTLGLGNYAPRWQQLDSASALGDCYVNRVFPVRGRLFAAAQCDPLSFFDRSLFILQPDGKTFEKRNTYPNEVRAAHGDGQGRTWVGFDNGVRLFTANGWQLFTDTVGAPPAGVNAIAEDQDGRIWLGGNGGLTLFDRERFVATFTMANLGLPNNTVNALLVDQAGGLWAGTPGGLFHYAHNLTSTYTTLNGLPSNDVRSLAQGSDGRLAVSTSGGLAFFNGTSFIAEAVPGSTPGAPLTTDDLGRIWHGNAFRASGGWVPFYGTNSGLINSSVRDVASDGSGLVWFAHGTSKGISVRGTQLPPLGTVLPTVSAISPSSGSKDTIVTITGTGFSANVADLDVVIGGARVDIVSATPTRLQVRIGPNTQSGSVSVSSRGQRVSYSPGGNNAFCAIPVITAFTPLGGNAGVQVTVDGANFDYGTIQLGGGAFRTPTWFVGPQQIRHTIELADSNGSLTVRNLASGGCPGYTAVRTGFRKFTLAVAALDLNQGMPAYGLMADTPTLLSAFFTRDQGRRISDTLEIDTLQYILRDADGYAITRTINQLLSPPTSQSSVPAALRVDTINAVNIPDTPANSYGAAFNASGGSLTTTFRAFRAGRLVGQASRTDAYRANRPINVLLVPMFPTNPTTMSESIAVMRARVMGEYEHVYRRMMPTGHVNLIWSPEVYREAGTVPIGDFFALYDKGHGLDMIRQRWNETHSDQRVMHVFGVVETSIKRGNAAGFAFGARISDLINTIAGPIDALCDIGSGLVTFFTFGLVDPGGCHLEVPTYVGLIDSSASNAGRIGETIAHEMGHTFSLVMPWAQNGDLTDNISHSTHDEISNGECVSGTLNYDASRTIYVQPHVFEPVVDPIGGQQYRPQLSVDDAGITATMWTDRAKALMSYNCLRRNNNEFFEPVDVAGIFFDYGFDVLGLFDHDLRPGMLRAESGDSQKPAAGPLRAKSPVAAPARLYASGVITPGALPAGRLARVDALGTSASPGMPFVTGVWLVQRDASDVELRRDGVLVLYESAAHESESARDGAAFAELRPWAGGTPGYFAATVVKAAGVARMDLVSGTQVLDTFTAGESAPAVTTVTPIIGPADLSVSWTASDGDGDSLRFALELSLDGGATWTPIGETTGASLDVGLADLPGTSDGRVRVIANDGLNAGSFTAGDSLFIASKPPLPIIGQPITTTVALEGRALALSGAGVDLQDGTVADANLSWSSSRDGALGVGARLSRILSVGAHTLTLTAKNSFGQQSSTFVTLTVRGDYDFDGLTDDRELGLRLNPLTDSDAQSDADGDGLPLVMELARHTNPLGSDSDADGSSDADEAAAGTDPLASLDNPASRPPNALQVSPAALTFSVDLARDTVLPQQALVLYSQSALSWTLSADVGWLAANKTAGSTLDAVTILIDVFELQNGESSGTLAFANPSTGQVVNVPVTVDVRNKAGYCDANGDGTFDETDISMIGKALGGVHGQPPYARRLDLNRDGVIDATDVDLARTCVAHRAMLPMVQRP